MNSSRSPRWAKLAALALFATSASISVQAADTPAPTIAVELRPRLTAQAGADGKVGVLEVRERITGLVGEPSRPLFSLPLRMANLRAQPYREGDVEARDEAGLLPLRITEEPDDPANPLVRRLFTPARPTKGAIELRYRASVTSTNAPRTRGPSWDLRGIDQGFTGGSQSFLILPHDDPRDFRLSIDWDLSAAPRGAEGLTTLGYGHVVATGKIERLGSMFLIGGTLHKYPRDAGALPFNAFWIGEPNFDVGATMAWTKKSYDELRSFFRAQQQAPYFLLGRPNPNRSIGGAATTNGFMVEYGSDASNALALRNMFTHEMIHHFTGALSGSEGMASSWFHEGLAEFYKTRVPARIGLTDFKDYLDTINDQAAAYYSNERSSLSNRRISELYWQDSAAQGIPYARGFVYFADLDAKIRAKTGDKRSLDDLVREMLERKAPRTEVDWRAVLEREMGRAGIDDFAAMLAGKLIVLSDAAFGSCLQRKEKIQPRHALGFADPALQTKPVVRNLEPGSRAAAAGLREDDRILKIDRGENGSGGPVTVEVERSGAHLKFSFDPVVGTYTSYFWAAKPDASVIGCVPAATP